jgi:hypothetical protein
MGEQQFPEVEGGGSLILAWQIRNKRVLVVGGGEASQLMTSSSVATTIYLLSLWIGSGRTNTECPQCRRKSHGSFTSSRSQS